MGMILISLGLLLLTCVQTAPVRELAVIVWLISFGLLGLRNTGAALGIYIAAVALYSNHFFKGTFSLFERPDHPALLLLVMEMGLVQWKKSRQHSIDMVALSLVAFLAFASVDAFLTGTLSRASVGQFARTFGIPFVLAFLLFRARPTTRDIRSFFFVLFIVAGYSAVVSVLWVTDLRGLIFPTWITDPAVRDWAGGWRAGGILMVPAWNGLLLSLVFCMVYLAYAKWLVGHERLLLIVLGATMLGGIFLTYSRAVYLGTMLAVLVFFWQRTGQGQKSTFKRFALIITTLVGMSFALLVPSTRFESRVGNEQTVVWRLEIWKIGLRMVPQRPLFGYGWRGYGENAASFFERSEVIRRESLESNQPAVHNTFLNVMIEYGLVGFLLYAATLYLLFKRASQRSRALWGRDGWLWILTFMGVYLIQAQFAVAQEPTTNLIFYCTLALLGGLDGRQSYASVRGWTERSVLESGRTYP